MSLWQSDRKIGLLHTARNKLGCSGPKYNVDGAAQRTCLAVDEEQPRPGVGSDVSQAEVHVVSLRETAKPSALLLSSSMHDSSS